MAEQTSRLAVIIDSSGAQKNADSLATSLAKLTQAGEKAETATENLSSATKDYNSWMKQGPKLADEYTKSTQAAAKATNDEARALGALLDKINPINAALNRLDDQQQALSKFKSKGMLDEETFTEYNAKLEQAREKLTGFSEALTKTGDTSRHAAHNMAMIPSQLSWMVTSIASGESPIMALIQQGSMLSGMMGGLGPTIKAVGAYLTGLVNPFTVAAAAVGVLGLAYYQGEQEQEAFMKSLILTGNQVGKTSGQLSEMAATISTATGSTQGHAASVIAQVVSAGTIAGDSLQKVSAAIVSMSDATGQATSSLVTDFTNIANDPVAAITKLNDQYHFLTLATYNQVKALQDEGDQQDAARVASDAYATALSQRASDIKKSLGTLETLWDSVGNAAKGAWDRMLDVGREQTLQQKLDTEKNGLGVGQWSIYNPQSAYGGGNTSEINILQSAVNLQNDLSGAISSANASTQRQITLQQQADKDGEQFATAAERRAKAINLENTYLKAGVITLDQYNSRVSRIDQMYKDPAAPKQRQGRAYTEDAGSRLLDQINQQSASLVTQLNTTEKLSSVTQQRVKFEQQIADIRQKLSQNQPITADQRSLLSQQSQIEQAYKRQEALQSSVTTLDDYRKMMLEIAPKEQKQNDILQKRLELLQKMVALKKLSPEDASKQASDLISKSVLPDSVISGVNAAGGTLKSGATNSDLSGQGMNMIGLQSNPQLETIAKLRKAQTDYASWLNSQEKAINSASFANEQDRQKALMDVQSKGAANQQAISLALHKTEMESAETSFSTITDSMGTMFGQQSGMYKAAFATQKAFAIAQAGIQLPMAMAQAMANLPFPENLAAVANVVALMGTITSSITSVAANGFQSGGYTGNGGVSDIAGVVHGQEFVMDAAATKRIGVSNLEAIRKNGLDATLSRSGFGTGAKTVSNKQSNVTHVTVHAPPITINGNPSDTTIQLVQQAAKQGAQQGYKMVAGDLAMGKGQVHKSLTTGYNTSRRTG